jgi:hypothetical protein
MREIIRIRGAASPSRPPGARVADGTGDLGQALGRHLHRGYREIGVPERRIESRWPKANNRVGPVRRRRAFAALAAERLWHAAEPDAEDGGQ